LQDRISADPAAVTPSGVRVGSNPGKPKVSYTIQCTAKGGKTPDPIVVPNADDWGATFESGHVLAGEYKGPGQGFLAEGWDLFNLGGIFARKTYQINLFE